VALLRQRKGQKPGQDPRSIHGSVTYTGKDVAYQLWKFGFSARISCIRRGEFKPMERCSGRQNRKVSPRIGLPIALEKLTGHQLLIPGRVIPAGVIECLRQAGFVKQADQSVHLAYEVVNLSPQAARILGRRALRIRSLLPCPVEPALE